MVSLLYPELLCLIKGEFIAMTLALALATASLTAGAALLNLAGFEPDYDETVRTGLFVDALTSFAF